jgi:adenine-specific DNA glycosylase
MWEFPREETTDELEAILPLTFPQHLGSFSHSVTNHRVRVHVSKVELDKPIATLVWMDRTEVAKAALPAPQRRALGLLDI